MASPGSLSDDDDCFFDSRDRINSAASSRQSSHSEPRAGELLAPQFIGRALHTPAVAESSEAARVAEAPAEGAVSGGEARFAAPPPPHSEPAAPPAASLQPAASPQPAAEAAVRPEAVAEAPAAASGAADAQPADAPQLPVEAPSPAPAAPDASPPLAEAVAAALDALVEAGPPAAVADAPLSYTAARDAPSYDTAPAAAEPDDSEPDEPLVLQWSPLPAGAAASAPPSAAPSGTDPASGEEPNLEVSMAHLRAMMLAMTSSIAGLERATAGMALSSEAPRSGESAYAAPELQPVPEAAPAVPAAAPVAAEKPAPVVQAAPAAKAEAPAAAAAAVPVAAPALAPVKTAPAAAEAAPVKAFAAELASLGLSEREIETLSVVKGSSGVSAADAKPRTTSEIAMAKIMERAAQTAAAKTVAPPPAEATPAAPSASPSPTAASALGKKTTAAVAKAPPVSTVVAKPASSKPAPNLSEITPQAVQAARPAAEVVQQRQAAPPAAPDWAAWADAVAASSFAARVPATGAAARSLADALAGLDARVARAAAAAAARTAGTCLSGPAHAQLAAVNAAQAALAAQAAEVLRSSTASWTTPWASSFATSSPTASPPAAVASASPLGAEPLPRARFASGCDSGMLLLWRADAYAPLAQRADAHTGALRCLCAVPGAPSRIASGGDDGALRLWALPGAGLALETADAPKEQAPEPAGSADAAHAGPVTALCALRGAPAALVTGGADGALRLWALGADGALAAASEPLQPPSTSCGGDALAPLAHAGGVVALAALVAPCAFVFASAGSADRTVRFWARASGGGTASLAQAHANAGAHAAPLAALAALPAGRLASASSDGTVWVWSVTGAPARRLQCAAAGPVAATHLAPLRHGRLAVGCGDATLRLLDTDADRDEPAATLQAHAGPVAAATPLAGGGALATAGADGSLALWLPPRAGSAADEPPLGKRRVVGVPQRGVAITALLALDA